MPALLGHNAFTYYAQNYAGIIRMSLLTIVNISISNTIVHTLSACAYRLAALPYQTWAISAWLLILMDNSPRLSMVQLASIAILSSIRLCQFVLDLLLYPDR